MPHWGKQVGIPAENIVVVENGQVVELADGKFTLAERNPGNYVSWKGTVSEISTWM